MHEEGVFNNKPPHSPLSTHFFQKQGKNSTSLCATFVWVCFFKFVSKKKNNNF
jgi:hypothetical protein